MTDAERPLAHGELAMLRADRDRLDWLSTATVDGPIELALSYTNHHRVSRQVGPASHFDLSLSRHGLRAAIDAAIQRERGA
jgi:hypothetical protein